MRIASGAKVGGQGYAGVTPVKRPEWHSLIAWDMLFNNLTTGLFLAAALGELLAPEVFQGPARWAYPLALGFLTIDLICLVLDLGDPTRFHHMLRVFKPSSPMSLGTWCLTAYSLPLTLIVAIDMLPDRWRTALGWVRWLALIGGLLPALGSALYKGVLLSTGSQPGWKDARWLGGYLANSAMLLGGSAMWMLCLATGHADAAHRLRPALLLILATHALPSILLAIDFRESLGRLFGPGRAIVLAAVAILVGMLVPGGLLLSGDRPLPSMIATMCLLIVAVLIRFVLVKLPHSVP